VGRARREGWGEKVVGGEGRWWLLWLCLAWLRSGARKKQRLYGCAAHSFYLLLFQLCDVLTHADHANELVVRTSSRRGVEQDVNGPPVLCVERELKVGRLDAWEGKGEGRWW
jgi:hypothetical protein